MKLLNLRDMRRNRGLSQRDLAARVGMHQPRISMIEIGTPIRRETAERLARALLCDVSDLMKPEEPTVVIPMSKIPSELLATLVKR
jgi:transcriptional regulator with XRE-family HTH domain